jgi:adenine deaminase
LDRFFLASKGVDFIKLIVSGGTTTPGTNITRSQYTLMDALALAMREAGRALGLDREIGTVEAGKRADLVLLANDPLKDIRALRRVEAVFRDGELVAHRGGIVPPGAQPMGENLATDRPRVFLTRSRP